MVVFHDFEERRLRSLRRRLLDSIASVDADAQQRDATLNFEKADASTVGGISTRLNAAETDIAAKANASDIPAAASSAPPSVGSTNVQGATQRFAREDHTHQSSVQAQRVSVSLTSGKGTWTFPQAYPTGTVPIVEVTAETPDGAAYYYDAVIIGGSVTNTGCTIAVNKVNKSVTLPGLATSLLGFVVNLFAPATGSVTCHCWARKPMQ